MSAISARQWLWIAVEGLVLGIVGFGWDRVWHLRNAGSQLSGAREVLEAHWLMLLGVAILVIALGMAVRVVHRFSLSGRSPWIAFAGSLSMVLGFAWDSIRHIQGTESAIAHSMIYVGLLLVIVGLPVALAVSRNWTEAPGSERSD